VRLATTTRRGGRPDHHDGGQRPEIPPLSPLLRAPTAAAREAPPADAHEAPAAARGATTGAKPWARPSDTHASTVQGRGSEQRPRSPCLDREASSCAATRSRWGWRERARRDARAPWRQKCCCGHKSRAAQAQPFIPPAPLVV